MLVSGFIGTKFSSIKRLHSPLGLSSPFINAIDIHRIIRQYTETVKGVF